MLARTTPGRLRALATAAAAAVLLPLLATPAHALPAGVHAIAPGPWLAALNDMRLAVGAPAVVENPEWSRRAAIHAGYMAATRHFGHSENPSSPHYDPDGHYSAQHSVVAWDSRGFADGTAVLKGFLEAPYHLDQLLDPRLRSTGIGLAGPDADTSGYGVIDTLSEADQAPRADVSYPIVFPPAGVLPTWVPATYSGNEAPDPLFRGGCAFDASDLAPSGLIMFARTKNDVAQWSASLTQQGVAAPLESCGIPHWYGDKTWYGLAPRHPLQPGTTYTARWVADGTVIERTFTTSSVQTQPTALTVDTIDAVGAFPTTLRARLRPHGCLTCPAPRNAGTVTFFKLLPGEPDLVLGSAPIDASGTASWALVPTGPFAVRAAFSGAPAEGESPPLGGSSTTATATYRDATPLLTISAPTSARANTAVTVTGTIVAVHPTTGEKRPFAAHRVDVHGGYPGGGRNREAGGATSPAGAFSYRRSIPRTVVLDLRYVGGRGVAAGVSAPRTITATPGFGSCTLSVAARRGSRPVVSCRVVPNLTRRFVLQELRGATWTPVTGTLSTVPGGTYHVAKVAVPVATTRVTKSYRIVLHADTASAAGTSPVMKVSWS